MVLATIGLAASRGIPDRNTFRLDASGPIIQISITMVPSRPSPGPLENLPERTQPVNKKLFHCAPQGFLAFQFRPYQRERDLGSTCEVETGRYVRFCIG